MGNGVALTDVGEELIAKAFALARAGNQTGDVDEFDSGRNDLSWDESVPRRAPAGAGPETSTMPAFGINCAEGVILSGDARFRQSIEER